MKVDKQNGNVKYCDESHTYWDDNGKYISVTTLIGEFCQPFDKEFWSAYKALEKVLSKDEFKMEKKVMLDTKKIDLKYLMDMYGFSELDFNKAQQDILDEWQKKNRDACERGTKIHADMEAMFTTKKQTELKKFGLGGKFAVNTNETLMNNNLEILDIEKGVFPEYLVYRNSDDGKFKLAGQIDLLIKDGNDIIIADYKTNEKLDDKSFFDSKTKKNAMMKYPLNNLMDCNKVHYALQLSTYAWMLQQINPKFNIKKLILIHHDHNGNVTEHEVNYMKDEVVRMCKWYKKQKMLKELEEKRKPIVF
jgi:ATP-dependent exoDNAse (exonuclease V) beta subunit